MQLGRCRDELLAVPLRPADRRPVIAAGSARPARVRGRSRAVSGNSGQCDPSADYLPVGIVGHVRRVERRSARSVAVPGTRRKRSVLSVQPVARRSGRAHGAGGDGSCCDGPRCRRHPPAAGAGAIVELSGLAERSRSMGKAGLLSRKLAYGRRAVSGHASSLLAVRVLSSSCRVRQVSAKRSGPTICDQCSSIWATRSPASSSA